MTVFCQEDVPAIAHRKWPMLNMVVLRHKSETYFYSPTMSASLILFRNSDENVSIRLMRRVGSSAAKQLARHMTDNSRSQTSLGLYYVDIPGLHPSVLRQLSEGRWLTL